MRQQVELTGRPASPGLAKGQVVVFSDVSIVCADSGIPGVEMDRLSDAIALSAGQVAELMAASDEETAGILEFQIAMLEDEELARPAHEQIEAGASAGEAWRMSLDAQIADYQAARDDYFQARASDMVDLKHRVLRNLAGGGVSDWPAGAILVGENLTPTRFLETDWSSGGAVVLSAGSPSSHVAMLARSRGVPMITDVAINDAGDHEFALVDGETGQVVFSPNQGALSRFQVKKADYRHRLAATEQYLAHPAVTADGQAIAVMVNIADISELDAIDISTCDGVGLLRTEFLFQGPSGLPDEETQFQAYRKVLHWAGDKPVTIRTADAGGDKPVPGLTVEEANPFLGLRGIRLSLQRTDIFRVQLRALARAAVAGNLKVMLPMITVPEEVDQAKQLLDDVIGELKRDGIACARPPIGIMVEVPAAAIVPEKFGAASFFSIGSNDLTQYVTASSRDNIAVAALNDPSNAAVMTLVRNVVDHGIRSGQNVSICGDAGGDPKHIPALIQAGIRTLSVAPACLGQTKATIADVRAAPFDG